MRGINDCRHYWSPWNHWKVVTCADVRKQNQQINKRWKLPVRTSDWHHGIPSETLPRKSNTDYQIMVARWYIFKKSKFGLYVNLVFFKVIWYIPLPVLVWCTKKHLATYYQTSRVIKVTLCSVLLKLVPIPSACHLKVNYVCSITKLYIHKRAN
jgi:hypothetical protein